MGNQILLFERHFAFNGVRGGGSVKFFISGHFAAKAWGGGGGGGGGIFYMKTFCS